MRGSLMHAIIMSPEAAWKLLVVVDAIVRWDVQIRFPDLIVAHGSVHQLGRDLKRYNLLHAIHRFPCYDTAKTERSAMKQLSGRGR